MAGAVKNQKEILQKLKIEALNEMQIQAKNAIHTSDEIMLLSPTGTGKTLAFLLPIIAELDSEIEEVQSLIIAPSRELAIQIEQVVKETGAGYKCNVFYGGRNFSKDRMELNKRPAILVGTPGRIADHLRRKTFDNEHIKTLVLDEFDKSLEIGFEEDMKEIYNALPSLKKKILTSATKDVEIPYFVKINTPNVVDFLSQGVKALEIKKVISPVKDKLDTLVDSLCHFGAKSGIIFCNFKESINRVSAQLDKVGIAHGIFYGGMEQKDRERALIKFRNGTHRLIIATDLAARGIDVPQLDFIIHYHLPLKSTEFTHRNGRTARMNSEGTAYVIQWKDEELPEFIGDIETEEISEAHNPKPTEWSTLFVSGGRKDKISKGDIAGLFMKQGGLEKSEIGLIELKTDCAFVAVHRSKSQKLIDQLNNSRVKKRKVRIYEV
ncbi:MAG: DEAD/DEAH box helicase [Saprospiraceae bacterium]|nr:DEAD/DEAH box helicase [Saprospiraceae bacterium]